jgi:hypothetical protein
VALGHFARRRALAIDCAAKLILDALEGYAHPPDIAIVSLWVGKRWGSPACTRLTLDVVRCDSV